MPFIETADRTSLFVTDWGSGPPVVFTHAWGLRSDQWTYQIPALAEAGLRCVLYDRRGHGRSDRPASGYDIDTLADDLAAVIDHFGLHEATLIGHSLGSKEAIRYLSRHGDARIARLVLIAPPTPLLRRTADNPDGLDPALIDANYTAVAADVPKWCADFEAAGPYFGSSPGGSPGLIDWTIRMIVDTPLPVLLETLRVNADVDMRAELQKIQVPALIIHGDQDASAPIELTGRKTAGLVGGACLTVYPGAGHGLYASDHDMVNADLLAFINGHPAAWSAAPRASLARTPGPATTPQTHVPPRGHDAGLRPGGLAGLSLDPRLISRFCVAREPLAMHGAAGFSRPSAAPMGQRTRHVTAASGAPGPA